MKGYTDPVNPWERRRESLNVPAGIKNVGNTCYINSLLQAFFMVPDFRAQILEFPIPQEDEALTEGQKLIRELQLLFTRMLLTERRYVDPQALVQFTAHSGAQGGEFFFLFLFFFFSLIDPPHPSHTTRGSD